MAHALHDCKLLSEDVTDAMPALVGLRHTSAQYLQACARFVHAVTPTPLFSHSRVS